jgi:hypothetical protein
VSVHICSGPKMQEVVRRADGERWCFTCRKRRDFLFIVDAPIELSYYGPTPHIECATCGKWDGDCFPGTAREWEE